jgi:hypothetical protein
MKRKFVEQRNIAKFSFIKEKREILLTKEIKRKFTEQRNKEKFCRTKKQIESLLNKGI